MGDIVNNTKSIEYLIIIGIGTMFSLIISFLLSFNLSQRKKFHYKQQMQELKEKQQNQLIEAAVRSEELERHRISEELHDEVGALLSATKLFLGHIKHEVLNEDDQQLHSKSISLLDESIDKVRSISHNLHSAILKELGLNEAIKSFLQKIAKGSNLKVAVETDDSYVTNNPENDISIYRIIQELCNNIIKHARATEILIKSSVEGNSLSITIKHNGRGLSQEEFEKLRYHSDGLGLKNIQNRIILLHGKIKFESSLDGDVTMLKIPIKLKT
jgi:two-component system NarL family sensor kinase